MTEKFPFSYTVRRTDRRTLGLEISREGQVLVRAPRGCSEQDILRVLTEKQDWISQSLEKQRQWRETHPEPDAQQRRQLIDKACAYLPGRVAYFAQRMGLQPAGITITDARSRFGSCSSRGRLCFSWRLLRYPEEAVDYVVVHELAHLVHMNHSQAFYDLIETVLPDYRERKKLLRG